MNGIEWLIAITILAFAFLVAVSMITTAIKERTVAQRDIYLNAVAAQQEKQAHV